MARQWSLGTSPAGLGPEPGQPRVPAIERKPTVSRPAPSRYATNKRAPEHVKPSAKCSRPPNRSGTAASAHGYVIALRSAILERFINLTDGVLVRWFAQSLSLAPGRLPCSARWLANPLARLVPGLRIHRQSSQKDGDRTASYQGTLRAIGPEGPTLKRRPASEKDQSPGS